MEIKNILTDSVKSLGIMAYIDNSEKMLEEFSWLYKSWIYSGCYHSSDLLIVHHPEVEQFLPKEPGVILIPCLPHATAGTPFEGYHYFNSIGCLSGEHIDDIAAQYPWLLRTDADIFLTPKLADFRPNFPVHGRGRYHIDDDFKEKMLDFCQRHGVKHFGHFGCGSSLMSSSELMIPFLRRQIYWCRQLMDEFGKDPKNWGEWPGWFRGVTTMYAAEIAANENYWNMLYNGYERILDISCSDNYPIDSMTFHIHAVHSSNYFSKFKLRDGAYQSIDPDTLDRSIIPQYCHWLAVASVEQVKQEANYPW